MSEPKENKPVHFVQMDALRFLAAFMVVFVHAFDGWAGWFGIPKQMAGDDLKQYSFIGGHLHTLIDNLGFGVDVFFLISGFLITYLLLKEKEAAGKIDFPKFFARRIFRIWPLYFFIIAISPFLVAWMKMPIPDYKSAALFYSNFHTIAIERAGQEPWTFPFAHFWSICIEEHFYLVWPFLVALIPTKKLPHALVLIIFASFGFRAWEYAYNTDHSFFPNYMHTLARIDALAIGGLAAWAYYTKPFTMRTPFLIRILLLGLLIWSLSVDNLSDWPGMFSVCFKKYFYLGITGFLMLNFLFNPDVKLRFAFKNPISYLGRCSYGIYLWGNILLPILIEKIIQRYFPSGNGWIYWPVVIGVSLLVPIITYEFLEKPFLKLKSRFAIIRTKA
jgi:peptidoglycan/LPS O-acetylase OafA/YrhL